MALKTGRRRVTLVGFLLLAVLALAVSGCEDSELGMTSSGGSYEKTFSNENVKMSFRMIGV